MSEEKRHAASWHKLNEAKKRGEIAYSRELTGATGFICGLAVAWITGWRTHLDAIWALGLQSLHGVGSIPLLARGTEMIEHALWLTVPTLLASAAGALTMAMLQARGTFSMHPIQFRFERMNPVDGLKRLFSARQLIQLLKLLLKAFLLIGVLVWVVQTGLGSLVTGVHSGVDAVGEVTLSVMKLLLFGSAGVFLLAGLIDFGHQYYEHMKNNRMNDDERKREFRNLEGDPHIKAELKAQRKSLLDAPVAPGPGLTGASVLLTNPTHFAVALFYEEGVVDLPVLVAKAADEAALALRREARQLGIPILESPPLTRRLFREVGLQQYIGEDHIESVAEIFRWLKGLSQATR